MSENMGLIHTAARMGYGRLQALGSSLDYDDLVQEMSELFIIAYDKFDESNGAKFSTYFTFAARNEINKIGQRAELERCGTIVVSAEKKEGEYGYDVTRRNYHAGTIGIEEINAACEDGASFEETIASEAATPEQLAIVASEMRAMLRGLSPLAAAMASMTFDPPEYVEREFVASQVHAEFARSVGTERRCRGTLTVGFVATFLERTTDIPCGTIRAAKREIMEMAKRGL